MLNLYGRLQSELVSIVVGEEERTFHAHESILLRSSLVLRKALSNPERHAKSAMKTIRLRDIESDLFAVYLHWLYLSTIPAGSDQVDAEDLVIAKAYVLGHKLKDAAFQNAVVDAIVEKNDMIGEGECFSPEAVRYIYDHMPKSWRRIRHLLIDLYVERCNSRWLLNCPFKERFPHSFLLELCARLMDRPSGKQKVIRAPYYYVITPICDNEEKEKNDDDE